MTKINVSILMLQLVAFVALAMASPSLAQTPAPTSEPVMSAETGTPPATSETKVTEVKVTETQVSETKTEETAVKAETIAQEPKVISKVTQSEPVAVRQTSARIVDLPANAVTGWYYFLTENPTLNPNVHIGAGPYTFEWTDIAGGRDNCPTATGWKAETITTTSGSIETTFRLEDERFNGRFLCYRVTDNAGDRVYYYVPMALRGLDRTAPNMGISVNYPSNTQARVIFNFREEKSSIAIAEYKVADKMADCSVDVDFIDLLPTLSGTATDLDRSVTVDITREATDKIICVYVEDEAGNPNTVGPTLLQTVVSTPPVVGPPVVSPPPSGGGGGGATPTPVTPRNIVVDINATPITGWFYFIDETPDLNPNVHIGAGPYTFEWTDIAGGRDNCPTATGWKAETVTPTAGGGIETTFRLEDERFNGRNLCYRVTDSAGDIVYYYVIPAIRGIDRVAPTVDITVTYPSNTQARVTFRFLEDKSSIAIADYKIVDSDTECSVQTGYIDLLPTLSGTATDLDRSITIDLTREATDKVICAYVEDEAGTPNNANAVLQREGTTPPPGGGGSGGGGGGSGGGGGGSGSNDPRDRDRGGGGGLRPTTPEECNEPLRYETVRKATTNGVETDLLDSFNYLMAPSTPDFVDPIDGGNFNYLSAPTVGAQTPTETEGTIIRIIDPCEEDEVIMETEVPRQEPQMPEVVEPVQEPYELDGLFKRCLFRGSYGDDVRLLQRLLNLEGYELAESDYGSAGEETTYFGPLTHASLKSWQEENDVEVTGVFDIPTIAKFEVIAEKYGYDSFELHELSSDLEKEETTGILDRIKSFTDNVTPIEEKVDSSDERARFSDLFEVIKKAFTPEKTGETETEETEEDSKESIFKRTTDWIQNNLFESNGSAFFRSI